MSEANSVLFSIIIPTCDRIGCLSSCLEALSPVSQQFLSGVFEVIVSDDGREFVAEKYLKERFPWVQWAAGPRRGPASNRNHGARCASGEWLIFTDDDCLPCHNWLAEFESAIEPGVSVLEGKTVCSAGLPSLLFEAPINEAGGRLWSCNFAIRRDAFQLVGMFDERFPFAFKEDEEFRDRLKGFGLKTTFVERAIVDHPPRRRPFGSRNTARWKSQMLAEAIQGQIVFSDWLMPARVLKVRFTESLNANALSEWMPHMASAIFECVTIMFNYRSWKSWVKIQL